jgi:hypothetical protein
MLDEIVEGKSKSARLMPMFSPIVRSSYLVYPTSDAKTSSCGTFGIQQTARGDSVEIYGQSTCHDDRARSGPLQRQIAASTGGTVTNEDFSRKR